MIGRPRLIPATLVLSGLLLTSCASPGCPTNLSQNPQQAGSASALSGSPDSSSVGSETAEEVFTRIAAQVPTASLVKVYTEDDDPNRLRGRPNGYTSKICLRGLSDLEGRYRRDAEGRYRTGRFDRGVSRRGPGEGSRRVHPGRP